MLLRIFSFSPRYCWQMGVEFAQKCTKCNAEDQTASFWFERIEFSEWKWNARFLDNVEIELHLKFLLHPKTIYYLPVECNFQLLSVERKTGRSFLSKVFTCRPDKLRPEKSNKLSEIIGGEPDNHDLFETSPFKKGGGRSLHCLSSSWEEQQLILSFLRLFDTSSYELVLHPLSFCNDQCYLCLTREGPSRAVMRVMKGSHAKQELYIQLYCKRGWWYW